MQRGSPKIKMVLAIPILLSLLGGCEKPPTASTILNKSPTWTVLSDEERQRLVDTLLNTKMDTGCTPELVKTRLGEPTKINSNAIGEGFLYAFDSKDERLIFSFKKNQPVAIYFHIPD